MDHHVAGVLTPGGCLRHDGRPPQQVAAPALPRLVHVVAGHDHGPGPRTGWAECLVDFSGRGVAAYTDLGHVTPERPLVPLSGKEDAC
ncbi:hypothetical protein [Streptomyces sp. NPDC056387]|uniref:hypothetical protein n=1 Tax=Streptomyces sp. NPDC056387 TaxID=3345803 RepID=UPI0035DC558E